MTKPKSKDQMELSSMPPAEPRMTPKQLKFVRGYVVHFNGTKAALDAGYSPKTATSMASENLRKPHIVRYIKRHLEMYALSVDEVVAKLGAMARGEIPTRSVHRSDGTKTSVDEHYEERLALENIAKMNGLFVDRHQFERIDGIQVIDEDEDEQLMIVDQDHDQS